MRHDLTDFDRVVLPELELPWPSTLHPEVQGMHRALTDWSERHTLLRDEAERDRYAGYRFAWLAGRCFPRADPAFAQWAADFMLWFFLFDDVTADRVESAERATTMVRRLTAMLDVLDLDELGERPVHGETAWDDLCRRLRALVPAEENYQRWATAMRLWFLSLTTQVFDQVRTHRVSPRSYASYRRYSAGLKPPLALADVANAGSLTPEEFHAPEARLLEMYATHVIGWSNDVLSAPAEVHEPATRSLVTVIKDAEPGRSWQEAVNLAVDQTHAEIAKFAELAEQVRRSASPQLAGWIDGCQDDDRHGQLVPARHRPLRPHRRRPSRAIGRSRTMAIPRSLPPGPAPGPEDLWRLEQQPALLEDFRASYGDLFTLHRPDQPRGCSSAPPTTSAASCSATTRNSTAWAPPCTTT